MGPRLTWAAVLLAVICLAGCAPQEARQENVVNPAESGEPKPAAGTTETPSAGGQLGLNPNYKGN